MDKSPENYRVGDSMMAPSLSCPAPPFLESLASGLGEPFGILGQVV